MAKIVTLKDHKTNEDAYPQTRSKAVYMADNTTLEQFKSSVTQQFSNYPQTIVEGTVTNLPDNEDIRETESQTLQLADRNNLEGMGYKILRRNKPFKQQVDASLEGTPNTVYEIRYNFDLEEEEVTIPEGCILKFVGGKISNGILVGNSTSISAPLTQIFDIDVTFSGKWSLDCVYGEWFGAIADGATDCTEALQKCLTSFKLLMLGKGTYKTTRTLYITSRTTIKGVSYTEYGSVIKKTLDSSYSDTVNAVIACTDLNSAYIFMEDLRLASSAFNVDYGLYFTGIHESSFTNVYIFECKCGFACVRATGATCWSLVLTRVVCNCNTNRMPTTTSKYGYTSGSIGFSLISTAGAGTSVVMTECWARDAHSGYQIEGIQYSSMIVCGADNLCAGESSGYAYSFVNSWFDMIECAMETCYMYTFIINYNSHLKISGFATYNLYAATHSEIYVIKSDLGVLIVENSKFESLNETYKASGVIYGCTGTSGRIHLREAGINNQIVPGGTCKIRTDNIDSIVVTLRENNQLVTHTTNLLV